jgi:hypothetical protein
MDFVRHRTGKDLMLPPLKRRLHVVPSKVASKVERLWIHAVLQLLLRAFRNPNVSLAALG